MPPSVRKGQAPAPHTREVFRERFLHDAPVYWYQVASPLKLMMDRLVCARP